MGFIGGAWKPWSAEEDKTLLDHLASLSVIRDCWGHIAEKLPGRSALACRQRYLNLRLKASGVSLRVRTKERRSNGRIFRDAKIQQPPPAPPHTSLTAEFFGDPLPGRSALDRRSEPETSHHSRFDRRYADNRCRITLATEPPR